AQHGNQQKTSARPCMNGEKSSPHRVRQVLALSNFWTKWVSLEALLTTGSGNTKSPSVSVSQSPSLRKTFLSHRTPLRRLPLPLLPRPLLSRLSRRMHLQL